MLIHEYRATEDAIRELQERLKSLSQNDKLKKEMEFEESFGNSWASIKNPCGT